MWGIWEAVPGCSPCVLMEGTAKGTSSCALGKGGRCGEPHVELPAPSGASHSKCSSGAPLYPPLPFLFRGWLCRRDVQLAEGPFVSIS